MAPSFQLSSLIASLPESEGGAWGPPATVDSTLNDVPYAPYSKGDKLGRMADWTQDAGKDGRGGERGGRQNFNRNYRGRLFEATTAATTGVSTDVGFIQINRCTVPARRISFRTSMPRMKLRSRLSIILAHLPSLAWALVVAAARFSAAVEARVGVPRLVDVAVRRVRVAVSSVRLRAAMIPGSMHGEDGAERVVGVGSAGRTGTSRSATVILR